MKKILSVLFLVFIMLSSIFIISCDRFDFLSEEDFNKKYNSTTTTDGSGTTTTTISSTTTTNQYGVEAYYSVDGQATWKPVTDKVDFGKINLGDINNNFIDFKIVNNGKSEVELFAPVMESQTSNFLINNDPMWMTSKVFAVNGSSVFSISLNSNSLINSFTDFVKVSLKDGSWSLRFQLIGSVVSTSTTTTTTTIASEIAVEINGVTVAFSDTYDFNTINPTEGYWSKFATVKIYNKTKSDISITKPTFSNVVFDFDNWDTVYFSTGGVATITAESSISENLKVYSATAGLFEGTLTIYDSIVKTKILFKCGLKVNCADSSSTTTTTTTLPAPVFDNTGCFVGRDHIYLSWGPVTGASTYKIYGRQGSGFTAAEVKINNEFNDTTTNLYYDKTVLPNLTTYQFVVEALDSNYAPGELSAFYQATTDILFKDEVPNITKILANSTGGFDIEWDPIDDATLYSVWYTRSPTFDNNEAQITINDMSKTSYSLPAVNYPGETYYIRFAAQSTTYSDWTKNYETNLNTNRAWRMLKDGTTSNYATQNAGYKMKMAVDSVGNPYVSFIYGLNDYLGVKKHSGTDWVAGGGSNVLLSDYSVDCFDLEIEDGYDTPYVIYHGVDSSTERTVVKMQSGTGWVQVGGEIADNVRVTAVAIEVYNSIIYAAYITFDYKLYVKAYVPASSTWELLKNGSYDYVSNDVLTTDLDMIMYSHSATAKYLYVSYIENSTKYVQADYRYIGTTAWMSSSSTFGVGFTPVLSCVQGSGAYLSFRNASNDIKVFYESDGGGSWGNYPSGGAVVDTSNPSYNLSAFADLNKSYFCYGKSGDMTPNIRYYDGSVWKDHNSITSSFNSKVIRLGSLNLCVDATGSFYIGFIENDETNGGNLIVLKY